jgi:hypothetical protein
MKRVQRILSIASGVAAALVFAVAPGAANAAEPQVAGPKVAGPAAGAEVARPQAPCSGPWVARAERLWEDNGVNRGSAYLWLHESGSTSVASGENDPNDGLTLAVLVEVENLGRFLYFDPEPNDRNRIVECVGVPIIRWKWVSVYQVTGEMHNESLPWQEPLRP